MPNTDDTTSTAEPLPAFAKEWMAQWRFAAQELPKIRDRELRALTDQQAIDLLDVVDNPQNDHQVTSVNGLVIQQAWFVRMHILQLLGKQR
jgi:hypothetical protein